MQLEQWVSTVALYRAELAHFNQWHEFWSVGLPVFLEDEENVPKACYEKRH